MLLNNSNLNDYSLTAQLQQLSGRRISLSNDNKGLSIKYHKAPENKLDYVTDHGQVHKNAILKLMLTPDSKSMFTLDSDGYLKQFNTQNDLYQERDYEELNVTNVTKFVFTSDSKYLFVGDKDNNVRMIDIKLAVLEKDYSNVFNLGEIISCIEVTPVSKQLLVGSSKGNMKQFNIKDHCLMKDYGQANVAAILHFFVSYLFKMVGNS